MNDQEFDYNIPEVVKERIESRGYTAGFAAGVTFARQQINTVRRPVRKVDIHNNTVYICPTCETQLPIEKIMFLHKDYNFPNRCEKCGQKLKTEDERNFILGMGIYKET